MQPLVSILIPAFNAERWISETLQSAAAQMWPRKEIIVVDDGSTDRTLAIAERFQSREIKVVSQRNQGAAAARNHAFSLSKGEYIQWLDADDLLSRDKIVRQFDALGAYSRRTLLSSAWGKFLHRPERAEFLPTSLWRDLSPVEWLLTKMGQNLHMQTATWLVSRELTEAAGPWNTSLAIDDDGEYFCRVLLASDSVRFAAAAKVYYRATPNSLSYIGLSNKKLESQWHSMELHIQYLRSSEDSIRTRAACVSYLNTWAPYFYPERMDLFERARALATDLGGAVLIPKLSWKYSWIDKVFGRRFAKRAQVFLPCVRWSVTRSWDQALLRFGSGAALNQATVDLGLSDPAGR
jgi:glycosyltransferase involved in cell wall biosynthesis